MACAQASILEPLSFPEPVQPPLPFLFAPYEIGHVQCVFCTTEYSLPEDKDFLLAHLYATHKFVISKVDTLPSLKGYLDYWRVRFTQIPPHEVCAIMTLNAQNYLFLSEVHPEDQQLRRGLSTKRLEWILECQRVERTSGNYTKNCMFCRYVENNSRADYLTHLAYQHNLQLGRPDNLVFVDRLIHKIEQKLLNLQCIYCENPFRDRETLKEHMRKKFHKRVNPKNKEYDKFYVKSYVEGDIQSEDMEEDDAWSQWREEGSDWSDWQEEPPPITCLFCPNTFRNWEEISTHMINAHRFSYKFIIGRYSYYEQVKIVNFIRREVHLLRCYECKSKFSNQEELSQHLTELSHCTMPERSDWDQPEFFFPTFENDTFLCMIEDEDDPVEKLTTQMEGDCSVANLEPS